MNGIEDRLRDAFGASAEAVRPHAAAHAENARRLRRARDRRRIAVPAGVVAGVAAAVAVGTTLPGALDGDGAADALSGGGGTPAELVDPATVVTIAGKLPKGKKFHADAVGADGSVVGRSQDGDVWKAGPEGGTPKPLGVKAQGGLATGRGFVTWIEPDKWELNCRTQDGRTRVIGPQGTTADRPVLTGGGMIVGNDPMDQPWTSSGCDDAGRTLDNHGKGRLGFTKAFAYPTLFAVDPYTDHAVREIDVKKDRIVKEHPLPDGIRPQKLGMDLEGAQKPDDTNRWVRVVPNAPPEQEWEAAANGRYFAWVVDGSLRVLDRESWKPVAGGTARTGLGRGDDARLTAGDRLVAYTTGERSWTYGGTGDWARLREWKVPVMAAGGWLLWRDGADYRVGRVR